MSKMSNFLKALGIAAVAAAVVPCQVEMDEETGVKTYRSLLSRLRVGPGEGGEGTDIRLDLLDGILPTALRGEREEEDFADEDLEDLVSEPIFEMKLERSVPAAPAEDEAAPEETRTAGEEKPAAEDKIGLDL